MLASRWQLPVTTELQGNVVLTRQHQRLVLVDGRSNNVRPLWVELGVYGRAAPGKRDPLLRALGRKGHVVVDATAGWGVDAAGLHRCGYRLLMLERHPVMAALLQDGIDRLGLRQRRSIELFAGDAIELLPTLNSRVGLASIDVVVLDTMYPLAGRTHALPRRELVLLRELAGADLDSARLLRVAQAVATHRVVVKRPHYAPPLSGAKADIVYRSKQLRYDVYCCPS